jgi:hypothetical protein
LVSFCGKKRLLFFFFFFFFFFFYSCSLLLLLTLSVCRNTDPSHTGLLLFQDVHLLSALSLASPAFRLGDFARHHGSAVWPYAVAHARARDEDDPESCTGGSREPTVRLCDLHHLARIMGLPVRMAIATLPPAPGVLGADAMPASVTHTVTRAEFEAAFIALGDAWDATAEEPQRAAPNHDGVATGGQSENLPPRHSAAPNLAGADGNASGGGGGGGGSGDDGYRSGPARAAPTKRGKGKRGKYDPAGQASSSSSSSKCTVQ